jgi:hypothetical protein
MCIADNVVNCNGVKCVADNVVNCDGVMCIADNVVNCSGVKCIADNVVNCDGVMCKADNVVNCNGVKFIADNVVNCNGVKCIADNISSGLPCIFINSWPYVYSVLTCNRPSGTYLLHMVGSVCSHQYSFLCPETVSDIVDCYSPN